MRRKTMYKTNLEALEKETDVFPFGASTQGGQRANRKKTGIHLRHLPSGIEVRIIKTPSQARNKKIAFETLQKRLRELNRPEVPRIPTRVPRSAKEKRLEGKKIHSEKKQLRRKPKLD